MSRTRRQFLSGLGASTVGLTAGCLGNPPKPSELRTRVVGMKNPPDGFTNFKIVGTRRAGFTKVSAQCQVWIDVSNRVERIEKQVPKSDGEGYRTALTRPAMATIRFWSNIDKHELFRLVLISEDGEELDQISVWINRKSEPHKQS